MSTMSPEPRTTGSLNGTAKGRADTEALAANLAQAIQTRTAKVGVIGLGYVGLPLVEIFAGHGFPVLGLDIDETKVERLEAGESYIGHIASERVAACGIAAGSRPRPISRDWPRSMPS